METRVVNTKIEDVTRFKGMAGLPWLIIAANPHLSISELQEAFVNFGAYRSATWVRKRRWMFFPPEPRGARPNADGKDKRTFEIIDANDGLSLVALSRLLKSMGIERSREWLRQKRHS